MDEVDAGMVTKHVRNHDDCMGKRNRSTKGRCSIGSTRKFIADLNDGQSIYTV